MVGTGERGAERKIYMPFDIQELRGRSNLFLKLRHDLTGFVVRACREGGGREIKKKKSPSVPAKKNRRGKHNTQRKCAKNTQQTCGETNGSTGDTPRPTRAFSTTTCLPRRFYAEHDCPIPRPLPRLRAHGRDGTTAEPACDRKTIVKALRACVRPPPRHLRGTTTTETPPPP